MKNILYIMCAVGAILAGCAKEDFGSEQLSGKHEVTISAVLNLSMADESDMKNVQTRSAVACNRYVIELYADTDYNTLVGAQQSTTDGNFALTLDRTKTFYALLWADNNASAIYDVTSLKAVTVKAGQLPGEAFYGKLTIVGNQAKYDVSLKRAVAKLNLNDTGDLPKSAITVKYNQKPTFSVVDGTTSGTAASLTATVTTTTDIIGTRETPVTLNVDQPIYVLASTAAVNEDFTFQYKDATEDSAETEFTVNAPVQANYNTNIKGQFSISDPRAKVGCLYYKNGTWSKINKATTDNPVIGVICAVNADEYSGKIVSLDEARLVWSSDYTKISGAVSYTDGLSNTLAVTSYSGYLEKNFPCVAWCVAKNTPAITGISWYVPASKELEDLWGTYGTLKGKINAGLGNVGGAAMLSESYYFSSTQSSYYPGYNLIVSLSNGTLLSSPKSDLCHVRAMSAFKSTN